MIMAEIAEVDLLDSYRQLQFDRGCAADREMRLVYAVQRNGTDQLKSVLCTVHCATDGSYRRWQQGLITLPINRWPRQSKAQLRICFQQGWRARLTPNFGCRFRRKPSLENAFRIVT